MRNFDELLGFHPHASTPRYFASTGAAACLFVVNASSFCYALARGSAGGREPLQVIGALAGPAPFIALECRYHHVGEIVICRRGRRR